MAVLYNVRYSLKILVLIILGYAKHRTPQSRIIPGVDGAIDTPKQKKMSLEKNNIVQERYQMLPSIGDVSNVYIRNIMSHGVLRMSQLSVADPSLSAWALVLFKFGE